MGNLQITVNGPYDVNSFKHNLDSPSLGRQGARDSRDRPNWVK